MVHTDSTQIAGDLTVQTVAGATPNLELVQRVFELTDLRPSTRKTYQHAIRDFLAWGAGRSLTPALLVEYKNHLQRNSAISTKTKNLYLASVRTVFRRLFELGVVPSDYSGSVKSFTVGSGHKRAPITDVQVAKVFAFLNRSEDPRLTVIFSLLYRQGLRQKEVVDLAVEHFDAASATLAILGKGRDDREVINLHPETVRAMSLYLSAAGIRAGFIFPSRKLEGRHLTVNQLYRLVTDAHAQCGVTNSPHAWRKVFTSRLIEAGMNLLDVQSYTRHRSVEQLKVYFDRISFQKSLPTYYETFPALN